MILNTKYLIHNTKKGYVALITVVILGVVATVVATSLVLLGLGHSRSALSENQTSQAKTAADACAEDALRQIRLSSSYTGTGNLTLTGATCSYTVTNTGGTTRQVVSSGVSGPNTRKNTILISALSPNIVFTSWQETP
jgi:hypothetical protein